eukprot:15083993-Alexandrium_andersonii.AAC.1
MDDAVGCVHFAENQESVLRRSKPAAPAQERGWGRGRKGERKGLYCASSGAEGKGKKGKGEGRGGGGD